jgi:hypothetical protein
MPVRISNILTTILSARLRHVSEFKGIAANERILKSGSITINGIKLWVAVNDTLKTLTEKINAKSHLTKVKAVLINTLAGAKLLLRPENQRLNFIDPDSIFVKAYLRGKFSNDKSIILQVIQDSSQNSSKGNHHKNTKVQLPNNAQLLSEFIKFALASYDTNNPATRATPAPVIIEPAADPIMEATEAPAEPLPIVNEIVAHMEPAGLPVTAALENFTAANEPEAPLEPADRFVATTEIKAFIDEPAGLFMTAIGQERIQSKAVLPMILNEQAQDLNKLIDINELKPQDDENKNRQEIEFVAKDIIKNAIFKAMKRATTTKIHPDLNQYITDQLCEGLDKKYKNGRSINQDGKQIEYKVSMELYKAFAKPDKEHKTEAYVLPSKKEFKLQDREKIISDIIDWIKKFAF